MGDNPGHRVAQRTPCRSHSGARKWSDQTWKDHLRNALFRFLPIGDGVTLVRCWTTVLGTILTTLLRYFHLPHGIPELRESEGRSGCIRVSGATLSDYFYFNLLKVNSPWPASVLPSLDVQWFIIEVGRGALAWEGEKDISKMQVPYFQVRRAKKRPFHERELIYSVSEIARTLGLSEMSIYRCRRYFPDFPKLITSKAAVQNWSRHRGVPLKKGPPPSERREVVVRMREQGRTFRQIAKVLRISHQAAHQHWKRHLRRIDKIVL